MKNRLIILSLFTVASVFCACSNQTPEKTVVADQNMPQVSNGSDEPPSNAEPPQSVITPGNDNSEIVTSYDLYGNRTETRTFKDHPYLDNIVIRTLADGSRIGDAFGKNGEKRPLTDNQIAVALVARADELADMAGLGGVTVVQKVEPVTTDGPVQTAIEPVPVPLATTDNSQTISAGATDDKNARQERESAARKAEAEKSQQLQREVSRLSLTPPKN